MNNKRKPAIDICLKKYGIESLEKAKEICNSKGIDVEGVVKGIQPIAFDNAVWAYTLGVAIAIVKGKKSIESVCDSIGEGLQAFCVPGSVADQRKIGIGHGELAKMLLSEETKCFCFLAGHESFAAAEGAMGIARRANEVRKTPLKVILNGLGKDAAYIIARINGFTFVETKYNQETDELKIVGERRFSNGTSGNVNICGGNSTNPVRFQHPVAGTYKKWCTENGKKYFSVASGGGTGRTLHPDNVKAGPASYGLTDTMGRMHCDAQFAGSSSVPAHVEMMGFIGMGNNPIVGASVALAVLTVKCI